MSAVNNFTSYINSPFGISIQYPSNWLSLDLSGNSSSYLIVVFKPLSGAPSSLNIISQIKDSQNLTFNELVNSNINNLRQSGRTLNLTTSTPSSLSGHPAYKMVYTTTSQGIRMEAMQILSLVGNRSYSVTYVAPLANYATYLPTVQTMIKTINIK
jgi:hypothetical protein